MAATEERIAQYEALYTRSEYLRQELGDLTFQDKIILLQMSMCRIADEYKIRPDSFLKALEMSMTFVAAFHALRLFEKKEKN